MHAVRYERNTIVLGTEDKPMKKLPILVNKII